MKIGGQLRKRLTADFLIRANARGRTDEMRPISAVGCDSWTYEYSAVRAALEETFSNLGGVSSFINIGDKVFLKVNLVMKKAPEAAATSHPVFVQALADILIGGGAEVTIGDSPGGPFNELRLRSVYQGCGMREAAERSGAELNFDTGSSEVKNPRGLILKKLTNLDALRRADKVINVSRLKTHGMMKLTGAVKNMFGTVPGTLKAEYHLNRPEPEQFADALIDICLCADPILSIIDGIVAMEGDGPTSGTPRNVGVVLASEDPFGLDLAAARIINAVPRTIPTVKRAIERDLCPEDFRELIYVKKGVVIGPRNEKPADRAGYEQRRAGSSKPAAGSPKPAAGPSRPAGRFECCGASEQAGPSWTDPLAEFAAEDFRAPAVKLVNPLSGSTVPGVLRRAADRLGQPFPTFREDLCVGCGDCARNCPPGAISMSLDPLDGKRKKADVPTVDLSRCIRCFCCQELCPREAVGIKRPWLFRVLARL